jgi:hypothetical protein
MIACTLAAKFGDADPAQLAADGQHDLLAA